MARRQIITETGTIPVPQSMDEESFKVVITSNGVSRDVTTSLTRGSLKRVCTVGLSNFQFDIDINGGAYVDVFGEGDVVDVYYNFSAKASLTTIRYRGYIDGVFENVDDSSGWFYSIEGRDAPGSSSNEHFADTNIIIQFTARNVLDAFFGTTGSVDDLGNYSDGILYNGGLVFQVYDTSDSTWKTYSTLDANQKTTLKSQAQYTAATTGTHVDKSRLTISRTVAEEGDYDFYIYYDASTGVTYLRLFPEESLTNTSEFIAAGQNFMSLNRYGKDTTEESNRVKEKGAVDGSIILIRTKGDASRQSELWIKDMEETNSAITDDAGLVAKASARLTEKKNAVKKGRISSLMLPTLQPGEKVQVQLPYFVNEYVKVKGFDINFGEEGIDFNLDLQDRETRFEKIFKDRIDESVSITPNDNPNGMTDALVFDFTDPSQYTLSNCSIISNVLTLSSGSSGTCTTTKHAADSNILSAELRLKANQIWACTYRITNDDGLTWENLTLGAVHTFSSTGKDLILEATLIQPTTGINPEFAKINLLYKKE